jgi:hypothetical protein
MPQQTVLFYNSLNFEGNQKTDRPWKVAGLLNKLQVRFHVGKNRWERLSFEIIDISENTGQNTL